jgi:hypothetical protein
MSLCELSLHRAFFIILYAKNDNPAGACGFGAVLIFVWNVLVYAEGEKPEFYRSRRVGRYGILLEKLY